MTYEVIGTRVEGDVGEGSRQQAEGIRVSG
jgi:hypothetical protein